MRLHLISLPHTATTEHGFEQCAFTRKCRDFPKMMLPENEVFLYATDRDDSGAKLVTCITGEQQDYFLEEYDWYKEGKYYKIPFDPSLPIWKIFTKNVITNLKKNLCLNDLILISSPIYYEPLHRAFPHHKIVEYGVGYPRTLAPYRAFESEAWRNYCYGYNNIPDHQYPNDAVIPNYYDPKKFPLVEEKEDYFVFMARPIPSKGWAWVQILASQGYHVKVAGAQEVSGKNIEWVGYVDGEKKADLLGRAKALLSPTFYLEPFGGVVAEAALCGTPAITTDWGVYKETVLEEITGFRASNYTEFKGFADRVGELDPKEISWRAASLWSLDVVGKMYKDYLGRL